MNKRPAYKTASPHLLRARFFVVRTIRDADTHTLHSSPTIRLR